LTYLSIREVIIGYTYWCLQ